MNCLTCESPLTGRKRKYCQVECRPSYIKPVGGSRSHCRHCKIAIGNKITAGAPKIYCSRKCSQKFRAKKPKEKLPNYCHHCKVLYFTAITASRFCSSDCRAKDDIKQKSEKWRVAFDIAHPDGNKTVTCKLCEEPLTFNARKSKMRLYHPHCSIEAQRARYRIKTVKRQSKKLIPTRVAADGIVRMYGSVCHICTNPIDLDLPRNSRYGLTVDHVIPISKGGTDSVDNMKPAHWICNILKSDKMPEVINA